MEIKTIESLNLKKIELKKNVSIAEDTLNNCFELIGEEVDSVIIIENQAFLALQIELTLGKEIESIKSNTYELFNLDNIAKELKTEFLLIKNNLEKQIESLKTA